jgi:type IV secretory pathway VirB2 component (pilin)
MNETSEQFQSNHFSGSPRLQSKLAMTKQKVLFFLLTILPCVAFAFTEDDPISRVGNKMFLVLFGSLGVTLCAIIMGATFILAKVGKVSWDQFLYIGFCTAGFLGTPSIITVIKSAVA